ncbi:ribosomal protein S18-alanine N-acetyltransferase [Brucella melitensis]|uniref:ribosomal protein S18-alanine N-acetyltransferase n=1 Tax=Brucella melitensis TaxID=29459 RepID=UPI0002CF1133|nr:ribosomal protein S18-alanine N-acetyltransferase [Brucella melitensis]ENQ78575.1 ribosomal-protein-alanine acetyltransferase [Brucella melitensis F10/05-2]ENQ86534.1 ribosomal-protein-alanine acetyltransferase [Brucella melitensis F3/02]ENT67886.1 ribosomal-protein-alanine acetyltransferase [Brucella melitensis B115]HAJ68533.1 ribosomal-protein-alanine N-acetyltransferase [Brucella melitensis]HAK20770.1 ribosomal-protein-alanine N-acetyltransferase [Brucella melitensis]
MMGFPFGRFRRRPVSIEPLGAQDSHAIQRIHAVAFHHGWSSDDFRSLIAQDTIFGFIARPQGKPNEACGFVLVRLVAGEAEILTIAVSRDVQRQGVGRMLMDGVLRHLYQERAETLFLEVDEANIAAQALYRRLGFQKVGDRPAYYETANGRSAALILRRDLKRAQ